MGPKITRPGTTVKAPAEWLKPLRTTKKPAIPRSNSETTAAPTAPWLKETTLRRALGPTNQAEKLGKLSKQRQQNTPTPAPLPPVNYQFTKKKLRQTTIPVQRNIPANVEPEKPDKPPPPPPAMMGPSPPIVTGKFPPKLHSTLPRNTPSIEVENIHPLPH